MEDLERGWEINLFNTITLYALNVVPGGTAHWSGHKGILEEESLVNEVLLDLWLDLQ